MNNHLIRGISEFIIVTPLTLIIFSVYFLYMKFILKRKIEWNSVETLCKFSLLLMLLALLNITSIIESILIGNFSFDSIANEIAYIQFNILLFIPFGFFTIMVFKKFLSGTLIDVLLSLSIEALQLFTGRFVQLEDVLMNTLGMVIRCLFAYLLLKSNKKGYIVI